MDTDTGTCRKSVNILYDTPLQVIREYMYRETRLPTNSQLLESPLPDWTNTDSFRGFTLLTVSKVKHLDDSDKLIWQWRFKTESRKQSNLGVFKCLENLENHHDTYTNNLGFHEPAENGKLTTCTYAQRISQLKSRRDELQRKLSVLKQMEEEAEGEGPEEEVGGARLAAAEEMLLREKLKLSCYQFVGISSIALDSNSDGNKITLRFETSHRNIVRESYFMELAQSDAGLTVCRHDLPCFVPLVDLEKEHLKTNTQLFLMHVSDYLQAYVKRREEANLVKEILGEISCDLSMTLPADYIEIKIGGAEWSFALEVQMTYANILKIIPTQVVMSLEFEEEEPEADQMRKWREHFKSQPLSVAMETVWLELRKFISAK